MSNKEVLTKARALIDKGWVQGCYAVNAAGDAVHPCSPNAVRWSAAGAICAAVDDEDELYYRLRRTLREYTPHYQGIIVLNDGASSKDEVLAIFDKAIADCK